MKGIISAQTFVRDKTDYRSLLKLIPLILVLWSCEPKERPPGINEGLRAVPLSSLSTTIDLPVNSLSEGLNKNLPQILAKETMPLNRKGEKLFLTIEKNRDLKLAYRSGELYVALPVKVTAVVEKKVLGLMVSNRDQPLQFSATVNFSGPFDLDENWQPVFDFTWRSLEWERAPIFDILGFRLDLTGTIDKQIKEFVRELNEKINSSVRESVDLKTAIENAWGKIQDANRLAVQGDDFFFRMNMSELQAVRSKKKQDTLSLEVYAGFTFEVSQRLTDRPAMDLPLMTPIKKKTKPMELYVDTRLGFEYLNKKAEMYVGQSFDVEGREITIQSVSIYHQEGYVHCELAFTGESEGKINMYGIPTVDRDRVFSVSQFGYQLTSDSELLKLTDAALHASFERMIEEMLSVPLLEQLPVLQSELSQGIANSKLKDKMDLDLEISDLDLHGSGITDEELQLIWKVDGSTQFRLKQGVFSKPTQR